MKAGWITAPLSQLCDIKHGFAFKSEFFTDSGDHVLLTPGNFHEIGGYRDRGDKQKYYSGEIPEGFVLSDGDLLVAMTEQAAGLLGSPILVPESGKFLHNQRLGLVTKKAGAAWTNEFFFHVFNSPAVRKAIHDSATGVKVRHTSPTKIGEVVVAFPASLSEQRRIVGILDEAFEGLATAKANAEQNLQNARALFESHLQAVFTQRGDGWVDRQLASLCHEITVGHVGSMKTEYKESGIPFLRSQNIRPFEVSMDNAMFIDEAFHRALKKSQLRPGDLAIVRTGYPGTAAVIPPELPDSNCSDLVIVRPSKEVNPHFLAAFFNSAFGKQLVLGKIVGAAQKHFNITAAKEVMLHVPPMQEQRAIIRMVDSLREETQRLESLYQRKLAALAELKKSLLHRAFSGQL